MTTWRIKPASYIDDHCTITIQSVNENVLGSSEKLQNRTFHKSEINRFMNKFKMIQRLNNRKMLRVKGKTGLYYLFTNKVK